MKQRVFHNLIFCFLAALLVGCQSNHDVVGHHFIQKRKYRKGFALADLHRPARRSASFSDTAGALKGEAPLLSEPGEEETFHKTLTSDLTQEVHLRPLAKRIGRHQLISKTEPRTTFKDVGSGKDPPQEEEPHETKKNKVVYTGLGSLLLLLGSIGFYFLGLSVVATEAAILAYVFWFFAPILLFAAIVLFTLFVLYRKDLRGSQKGEPLLTQAYRQKLGKFALQLASILIAVLALIIALGFVAAILVFILFVILLGVLFSGVAVPTWVSILVVVLIAMGIMAALLTLLYIIGQGVNTALIILSFKESPQAKWAALITFIQLLLFFLGGLVFAL